MDHSAPVSGASARTVASPIGRRRMLGGVLMASLGASGVPALASDGFTVLGWVTGEGRSSGAPQSRSQAPRPAPASPASPAFASQVSSHGGRPSVQLLWDRCHQLSRLGLHYQFGGDDPSQGGMDCSGTVRYVVRSLGYADIPRTSYSQYEWLGRKGTLKKLRFWNSEERAYDKLRPGDLVFWGGTYNSGHRVSHVMIYMGRNPRSGKQYVFGARGRGVTGLHGSGVDVFEFSRGGRGHLVGYGTLPGIAR